MEKLKEDVMDILRRQSGEDYVNFAKVVVCRGCECGVVTDLTLIRDVVSFYGKHKHHINALLADLEAQPEEVVLGWDKSDPLALEVWNQRLLVWLAVEWAAAQIAEESPGE